MKPLFFVMAVILFSVSIASISAQSQYEIPTWFKGVANFWVEGNISDDEFGESISFLIDNEIVKVPLIQDLRNEISQLTAENIELRSKLDLSAPVPESDPIITNLVPEKQYHENGNLRSETEYHDNGNIKFSKYYYENGDLDFETEYHDNGNHKFGKMYDENGDLEHEIRYHDNGNIKSETQYDENGNIISEQQYDEHGNDETTSEDMSIPMTYAGTFIGVNDGIHNAEGDAYTIPLENGRDVLRLENFRSTNGPDLYVYLATDDRASDFINLGPLRANQGNQNYDVPDDADLTKYNNVLIWCKAFSVLFGSAEILPQS